MSRFFDSAATLCVALVIFAAPAVSMSGSLSRLNRVMDEIEAQEASIPVAGVTTPTTKVEVVASL